MRRLFAGLVCVFLVSPVPPAAAAATGPADPVAMLTELDARQKDMVARADLNGLADLAHPDLRINAPTNRVLTRDQFLAMMRNGQIGAEAFERTAESVTVSGHVGVVMGNEIFTPTAASELGRTYGVRPLTRRYTNVYVLDGGRWKWLARQANVVPDAAPKTTP
jgi:hypothetical protein